jgi:hypothetical protein
MLEACAVASTDVACAFSSGIGSAIGLIAVSSRSTRDKKDGSVLRKMPSRGGASRLTSGGLRDCSTRRLHRHRHGFGRRRALHWRFDLGRGSGVRRRCTHVAVDVHAAHLGRETGARHLLLHLERISRRRGVERVAVRRAAALRWRRRHAWQRGARRAKSRSGEEWTQTDGTKGDGRADDGAASAAAPPDGAGR